MIDDVQRKILEEVADLHETPVGAYNIRANSQTAERNSTANISITSKTDVSGIDIRVKDGTKNESIHIPVVISQTGLKETVYNDFYIGENCDVLIVAGCGISNCGNQDSQHDGVHRFYVGKNSKIRYVEKHYGEGDGSGQRLMNPGTEVYLEENSVCEMEMTQIGGINSTHRRTVAALAEGARLVINERIMTQGNQQAYSEFHVDLNGKNCSSEVTSRSVAKEHSYQEFNARINGNAPCHGHSSCDALLMDDARVLAIPQLDAADLDATLIHEAAIGRIAGEQITKLMTLGLTQAEAEDQIVKGFLK